MMLCGCSILPEMSRQPQLHNPFPQLCKVAVAPFFNLTNEPTLDGRKVAIAYFNELQSVPGFEVVPVGVVETAMNEHKIELRGPAEARRLAQILKVDAVVIGAVTDYFPYYPPRMALQVEWYAANPGFHPIPAGYGLPWGTSQEKDIPGPLIFEAELALAKEQLKTQTPPQPATPVPEPPKVRGEKSDNNSSPNNTSGNSPGEDGKQPAPEAQAATVECNHCNIPLLSMQSLQTPQPMQAEPGFPPDWPDPRGFIPPPPRTEPPPSIPSDAPVLRHTRTYNGNDMEFTTALEQLLRLSRRRPIWGLAKLPKSQRRLYPILLPHAHQRNAYCPGRRR